MFYWRTLFYLTFLCLFISFPVALTAQQSNTQDNAKTQRALKILRIKIKSLQQNLTKQRKQQSSAIIQLKRAEKKIATATKILASTKRQLKGKQRSLKILRNQQHQLARQKEHQKKALGDQLRAAYMNGKQAYLKILLSQQDPEKLGRMLVYYDYMNKARSENLNKLKATLKSIKLTDLAIQNEIQRLDILKQSKIIETNGLLKLKIKRRKLVAALTKEIISKTDQLTELEINAQELQQLIDSVQETIDEMDFTQPLEGLRSLKGHLNWPVKGSLLRQYGTLSRGQRSRGILIAGKEGTDVVSIHHGRVVYADWLRGFGLLMILDHGQGYMSLYGYNQALYKDVGDWVEAGESVATLGQSGGQKRAGLYFELRHQGKPINPTQWLFKR